MQMMAKNLNKLKSIYCQNDGRKSGDDELLLVFDTDSSLYLNIILIRIKCYSIIIRNKTKNIEMKLVINQLNIHDIL